MKRINLSFGSLWSGNFSAFLPSVPGIYCVFRAARTEYGKREVKELLYIDQSIDLKSRILNHERWLDWRSCLAAGEDIVVSFALIDGSGEREQAEAAMIHVYKPRLNSEYIERFPYPETILLLSGPLPSLSAIYVVRDAVEDVMSTMLASHLSRVGAK